MSELRDYSERTCRKPRRCWDCRRMVQPGERYVLTVLKSSETNDRISTAAYCAECAGKHNFAMWKEQGA